MRTALLLVLLPATVLADASAGPARRESATTPPAAQRRFRDWDQLVNDVRELVPICHAVGKQYIRGRTAVMLPADCFFAPGRSELRSDAAPRVAIVAAAIKRLGEREVWVGAHADEKQPRPFRLTSAQAGALVEALVAAGVPAARLIAIGFGSQNEVEVYDGISMLAPGQPLVELAVAPGAQELPAP